MGNLMKLLFLLHLTIVISIVSTMSDQTIVEERKQIDRFERQFSFADGLTSGSILRNLWKRNVQFDRHNHRSRRQFTSFADSTISGTLLNNLWRKREAVLSAGLGGGRTKRYSSAADYGFTSSNILSNLWKRETVADNEQKTALNVLRTNRSDADLWKRQAFFDAESQTFNK